MYLDFINFELIRNTEKDADAILDWYDGWEFLDHYKYLRNLQLTKMIKAYYLLRGRRFHQGKAKEYYALI